MLIGSPTHRRPHLSTSTAFAAPALDSLTHIHHPNPYTPESMLYRLCDTCTPERDCVRKRVAAEKKSASLRCSSSLERPATTCVTLHFELTTLTSKALYTSAHPPPAPACPRELIRLAALALSRHYLLSSLIGIEIAARRRAQPRSAGGGFRRRLVGACWAPLGPAR